MSMTLNFLVVSSGLVRDDELAEWVLNIPPVCCYHKPCHEHISQLAYHIWRETGRDDSEANWFEAESILNGLKN